jgi:hypothetical protein
MISAKQVWDDVKTVIRNLPTVRKELVCAATAGVSMVAVFEVTFPAISTPHLAFLSSLVAALVGVASFLSNNKVVDGINEFANQPVWKAKLVYLVRGKT